MALDVTIYLQPSQMHADHCKCISQWSDDLTYCCTLIAQARVLQQLEAVLQVLDCYSSRRISQWLVHHWDCHIVLVAQFVFASYTVCAGMAASCCTCTPVVVALQEKLAGWRAACSAQQQLP